MDEIRRIARAYYDRASEEEENQAKEFFRKLDLNGDGEISLTEFKKTVSSWLSDDEVFKKLDSNGDGALDFSDVLVLFYMQKKAITIAQCDGCRELLFGQYFSCFLCLCKWPKTYDLCRDCYRGGKFEHEHPLSNLLHGQALLVKLSQRTTNELKTQAKSEMEELREIAKSHYRAGSPEVQALAKNFFKSMDSDGDEQIDLPEFLSFMRQQGYSQMRNRHFFKELDRDGNGTLDFWEVMTLYYIIKSGRPFCDWCGDFIPGIFFSCVECFNKGHESSFNLCRDCYQSTECKHNHNGRTQFLDNYTLLQAKRDSALGQAAGTIQNEPRATQARSPVPSNATVQAPNTTTSYNIYYVNPPSPGPTYSNAIVPASKMSTASIAFKAFEMALAIGNISSTMCTIL